METVVKNLFLEPVFSGKKVLITGHTGFKGTWLTLWLQQLGAQIKGYALPPEEPKSLFTQIQPLDADHSILEDIRNKDRLKKEVLDFQPDFIFHLAAQALVRPSYEIPAATFEINAMGTAYLLEAIQQLPGKCTAIIVTTDKVYENKETHILYQEADPLGGYDPYSASKACTELVSNAFRSSFFNPHKYASHLKTLATARAGNVIGGGDYSPNRIIPDIVRSLKSDQKIQVRNPASVRPWQHVLEPLAGYLSLAAQLDGQPNLSGAYNFGPEPTDHLTVGQLVQTAIDIWGKGSWEHIQELAPPHEAGLLQLDIQKAKNILGWKPRLTATEAIEWSLEWYRHAGSNPKEFTLDQIHKFMTL